MAFLPTHILEAAGLPAGTSAADFIEWLRSTQSDFLDGLLGSDHSKDAALLSLETMGQYVVRVVRQVVVPQERFCRVHFDGLALPVLVALLRDPSTEVPLATDMESLILWGILQHGSPIGAVCTQGSEGMKLDWRVQSKGLAVVAYPLPHSEDVSRSVSALFGLEDVGLGSTVAIGPVVASATELHIGAPTRVLSVVQARLFFEAVASEHPKWRFLSFYRLLENAYLANVKRVLLADFEKDAGRAVEAAKKKLQSEVNQLLDLMTEVDLEAEFMAFGTVFDELVSANNQYLIALDRGAEDDPLYRGGAAKKAVLRFYKTRCSIAHAGTSSVIFEQMPDSVAAMSALLPSVEAIVLKSLRITATAGV